ncbi:outer membrane lipoprotein-sorting protein [Pseudomaricurvus alkylphenolicus]|uniref:outer membrane lipoprotein-sorting protein n=1 Tax=Pseudomaricurvus alkylphenolicus TaxID=1306991 RepID=UPI00197FEFE3|nr:outer membrane lipoprotein-sorting protein [Pseudomaricurvus alkylphenolicus]
MTDSLVHPLFRWIVDHPKRVILVGLAVMITMASFAPQLQKDTRADAFLADDNPALVYRDKVKALFGLSDPMVIAVVAKESIFTPDGLNAVQRITEAISRIDNIDPDGITSLATENNIVGTYDGMKVEPFYETEVTLQTQADAVRDAIRDFPLYQGSLVANDETATLIVAEILDNEQVEATYNTLLSTIDKLSLPQGHEVHVAGEGAIAGYLGSYIDADAQRLNPIAAMVITLIVFIAFLRFGTTLMANVIIAASVLITVGAMAALETPFFVITNALPVILIGISVADSIHVYSEYFERRALHPQESIHDSIVFSMVEMWRPITLTTLTTAAGFLGLYFAAYMPPFKYFGLYTALGVSIAWAYSLLFLPAAMSLLRTPVSQHLARKIASRDHDIFARLMARLGKFTQQRAKLVVRLSLAVIAIGFISASQLVVNEERIATFHPSEPLYVADNAINSRFDGTNYLDIVIETREMEGIFEPSVLNKIAVLQQYAEALPGVQGSTSIVDYLKQMNRALNEGRAEKHRLPQDRDLIAQYFLLYSASGEPNDFEEEVDYDYRLANVRVILNTGAYIRNRDTVEALDAFLANHFNDELVTGTLSGRVNLNYHWIKDLGISHFAGMGIALFLVWLVSSLLFRSAVAGFFALIPVATSILLVYSAMVGFGIPLGIGTSMFAAVAIGLGVDFAIHTIDRLRSLYQETGNMSLTLERFYPTTGRALFFNLLAIALGFGVLISSKVVPLNNFGTIVALSVTTSFLFSMVLLPALVLLFRPNFITSRSAELTNVTGLAAKASLVLLAAGGLAMILTSAPASADTGGLPEGRWVAEQVNAVDDGEHRISTLSMKLVDRRGKERTRETKTFRKYFGEEKRTALFYLSPRNVKDTGFLTYDYPQADIDDDQWLYLPALRKARRISASDRGDNFLGTDFTYEDIKNEGKFELSDYHFRTMAAAEIDGIDTLLLEAIPVDQQTAKELGYGKVLAWVDRSNWIVVKAQYWDINLNGLKTVEISDIRKIDDIWTRHRMDVTNHKTGHSTTFVFSDVDYQTSVSDNIFGRQALTRGVPR